MNTIQKINGIFLVSYVSGVMSLYAADANAILKVMVEELLSPLYQGVAAFSVVYFLYGAAKFIYDMNHPEEKNTGKQHLLWGSIGVFIILSVGGILSIFTSMFGSLGFN
ncbi:MAG: hypothetical protein KBC41_02180 [Candidatus Pacebacteria bacterium]|nr:hypothetical protein [Candidatus Paceibacterota bacterium]MBP9866863.1 hypothetical protein [Candidatus Paceibacterota bacterium]